VGGFAFIVNRGGQMKICGPCMPVRDLLQMTKLFTIFDVYDDENAAIKSFFR